MKILLTYISGASTREDAYLNLLPAGLCYLQAFLRQAGHNAILANLSAWPWQRIRQQMREIGPRVVAISQWTHNRHESLQLARMVRETLPEVCIVLGGGHASFRYAEILVGCPAVDLVVIGEGEATLLEICQRMDREQSLSDVAGTAARSAAGAVVLNPPRPTLEDLDRLPFQSQYLEHSIGVDQPLQAEFILTSRGCPSACRFCSSPAFWNRQVRFRSPENILAEILSVRERYGLIYFSIRDDTFTADRRRTLAFCRLLIESRAFILWNCQSRVSALDAELLHWMKRAGCECVQLGIESGSPATLKRLGKQITPAQVQQAAAMVRAAGISLSVYLISDIPGETKQDLQQTVDLIRTIKPDDGYVSPLAYYPGTRLYQDDVAAGSADRGLFEKETGSALLVSATPHSCSGMLLKALEKSAPRRPSHRSGEYCYTESAIRGERLRQAGDVGGSERLFREMTEQEADNPWGWYLLAELYLDSGESTAAAEYYRRVLEIVPRHAPSLAALAELSGKRGEKGRRRR